MQYKSLKLRYETLVHFKSKEFSSTDIYGIENWHDEMNSSLKDAMYNAYETVLAVMKELDKLYENKTSYFLEYITDAECHA